MKAAVCEKYGPPEVLKIKEIKRPKPGKRELLIKLSAVAVATEDPLNRRGEPVYTRLFTGLTKPRNPILGAEFSGVIEGVGEDVRFFKDGDQIFGSSGTGFGCYAEYVCVHEDGFLLKRPDFLSPEQAAPVCAALAAWNFLVNQVKIQDGQKVLINGASGNVGTAAVQIAKSFGAIVTGVCSTKNMDLVRSLGADEMIDYTQEDFTKKGFLYDVVFDVSGKSSFKNCKKALNQNGIYLSTVASLSILFQMLWSSKFNQKKAKFSATGLLPVKHRISFLQELLKLYETGTLRTLIDRTYSLDEIVEAHHYVEKGFKKGNVVIKITKEEVS